MEQKELSERARLLLKILIERHIRDGQPVRSKTLVEAAGLPVSAATVRNVMSDLEERGYLRSPHTSSGRVPTSAGYRLFVDSLLQVEAIDVDSVANLRDELNPDLPVRDLVQTASRLVSSITSQAGLVTVPRKESSQLRQMEFLPLDGNRVLVIMVVNEREVQNRIIRPAHRAAAARRVPESALLRPVPGSDQAADPRRDGGRPALHRHLHAGDT